MDDRRDITVCMPAELDDEIKNHLNYGDSKSQWIREAIRHRLSQDDANAGPDTALEAHGSDSGSGSGSGSDSRSPDEQSSRGGGIMQRPK